MKAHTTYQEAQIDNPKSEIYIHNGKFIAGCNIGPSVHTHEYRGFVKCNPSDYCMTLQSFFASGYKFVPGDAYLNISGAVLYVTPDALDEINTPVDSDYLRYVLRAEALEALEIPTETPGEKKALDGVVEWNSEDLPPVGVKCCFTPDNNMWGFESTNAHYGEVVKYEGEQFIFLMDHDKYKIKSQNIIVSRTDKGEFSKPESPKDREYRERLEAAYDLFLACGCVPGSFEVFKDKYSLVWLKIVDKTNYRVGQ